jgi:hypothetical protein
LSGFTADNPLRREGDMNVYLPPDLYGIVEIGHLAICHAIVPALHGFLQACFRPRLDRVRRTRAAHLRRPRPRLRGRSAWRRPDADRVGFRAHNALRGPNGRMAFLDFEYFGWDDPLTRIGNFVLHRGMELAAPQCAIYQDAILAHFGTAHARRLAVLLPLFALRWCAIILSGLLPERVAHRSAANALTGNGADIEARQLAKADRLLALMAQGSSATYEGNCEAPRARRVASTRPAARIVP